MGRLSSTVPGAKQASNQVVLSIEEEEYHQEKAKLAKQILQQMHKAEEDDHSGTDDETLEPPTGPLSKSHFNRRRSANIALAAAEEYIQKGKVQTGENLYRQSVTRRQESVRSEAGSRQASKISRQTSRHSVASKRSAGKSSQHQQSDSEEDYALHHAVTHSLRKVVKGMSSTDAGRQQESAIARARAASNLSAGSGGRTKSPTHYPGFVRQVSGGSETAEMPQMSSSARQRFPSVMHDEVNQILKTGGTQMARLTPLSHDKPELKDPMGIQCVSHLKDPRWKDLARGIRDTIYDPEFYDDGTYGPMYVRLGIHAALTWNHKDGTGGCEGGAMRFKPEYSDAHNKFCKPIIKRQHDLIKVPFPWASYADIQVLSAYVSIECAGGPVIPFSPGRRDVRPDEEHGFVYQNYRVRGDRGEEGAPVVNTKARKKNTFFHQTKGDPSECPFLTKTKIMPGRLPGPEAGLLGKVGAPVPKENEEKELREVAKEIRHVFVDTIGTSEQFAVALIAGGHSFGRCHPEISGYAGPWQSNPGYFNNVYCQKLLHEDWKLVDKNMEDCSGDLITGVKPKGMRRQYVNKGGKGDIMMLVSDMALKHDPAFNMWLKVYANDLGALKDDFKTAYKWITEVGFDIPAERTGLAKVAFDAQVTCDSFLRWIGSKICSDSGNDDDSAGGGGSSGGGQKEEEKVGNPYTMEEVAKHTKPSDVWVVINKKVVDLSKFKDEHPGGEAVIMQFAGKDASAEWNVIHSRNAIEKLAPQTKIGYLA